MYMYLGVNSMHVDGYAFARQIDKKPAAPDFGCIVYMYLHMFTTMYRCVACELLSLSLPFSPLLQNQGCETFLTGPISVVHRCKCNAVAVWRSGRVAATVAARYHVWMHPGVIETLFFPSCGLQFTTYIVHEYVHKYVRMCICESKMAAAAAYLEFRASACNCNAWQRAPRSATLNLSAEIHVQVIVQSISERSYRDSCRGHRV